MTPIKRWLTVEVCLHQQAPQDTPEHDYVFVDIVLFRGKVGYVVHRGDFNKEMFTESRNHAVELLGKELLK